MGQCDVAALRTAARTSVSLQQPFGDDGGTELGMVLAAAGPSVEDRVVDADSASELDDALDILTAVERAILRLRFGIGDADELGTARIGKELGISMHEVRVREKVALEKLREVPELRARAG